MGASRGLGVASQLRMLLGRETSRLRSSLQDSSESLEISDSPAIDEGGNARTRR